MEPKFKFKKGDKYKCLSWTGNSFTEGKIYVVAEDSDLLNLICNYGNPFRIYTVNESLFKKVEEPQIYMCVAQPKMLNEYLEGSYNDMGFLFYTPERKRFTHTSLSIIDEYLSDKEYKLITAKEFREKFPPPTKTLTWTGLKIEKNEDFVFIEGFPLSKGEWLGLCDLIQRYKMTITPEDAKELQKIIDKL